MARIRTNVVVLVTVILAPTLAQAQFLEKLKKTANQALDVAEEVDRFTFTEAEEIELGEAISFRIRSHYGVAQDLEPTRYLSLVGRTVTARSDRAQLPWRWIILDSGTVNAFAAPGGWIHVTRGALAIMQSEGELAGVLAHEVGHVTRKHTLKGLQKSMGMELARDQADFGAGSDLFNAVADQAAQAVMAGFSQAEELEADEVGIQMAARAGYDPGGLPWFLEALNTMTASSSSKSSLFRTHPDTEERIEQAKGLIDRQALDDGLWLEERYLATVPYDIASSSTGGSAVESARGVAGSDDPPEAAAEQESGEEGESRFSLAQLATDPFELGGEEESAEVSGAGAGRAVGEETDDSAGGPKNPQIVAIDIQPMELATFKSEGGLP